MNLLIATIALLLIQQANSYKMLFLMPFSGKSHYINMLPIVQELANRGHELTVIAPYVEKNANYKQVTCKKMLVWELLGEEPDMFALEAITARHTIDLVQLGVSHTNFVALESIQDFIDNDNSHFDLIFTEAFFQEVWYMFQHKYKAPLVGFSTMGLNFWGAKVMGSPLQLSFMSHDYLSVHGSMSFWERLHNLYLTMYDFYTRKVHLLPLHQAMAEKFFAKWPQPLPKLEDLERNLSAMLISTHFSYDTVKPYVPGIIEIGGVHIKEPKPLPPDLQKYLDDSKDGAIFFSLGSNVKCANMPKDKLDAILDVFRKLKMRVLWKWEDDKMPNKPKNVMINKWLPQNDILAHPNVKLFITHGGLLSTQEAMHHGVPVIGLPLFADQHLNTERLQGYGLGIKMLFSELTVKTFSAVLDDVLNNPKYRERAAEVSSRFRDRPLSPMNTTIFWIEYVIRQKGATFMRSPASDLPWHVYLMLDVYAFLLACAGAILFVLWNVLKSFFVKSKDRDDDKKYN